VSAFVIAAGVAPVWEAGMARLALAGQALLSAVAGIYLAFYVAGEDDYRDNGISRWEAYDAHGLSVAAVALALAVSLVAVVLAARPRKRFLPALGLAGLIAAAVVFAALFANSLN